MCDFHMYPKFFVKFLQILHGQLPHVHCLILCLKTDYLIFLLFFLLFGKFPHRIAAIVLIVSISNLFVLMFLLATVKPDLKL